MIVARDGEEWFKHSLDLVRDVLPVFEEVVLDGPHHLHMSAALLQIVTEIRRFLAAHRHA